MKLAMPGVLAQSYKSPAQQARVVTEAWGEENLFCPGCDSMHLTRSAPNREAIDYACPRCRELFQLKSRSSPLAGKIVDAAYDAMQRAIISGHTPNLFALHYSRPQWEVVNLMVVPRFAYSLAAIEKRKPLALTARRANWVGCNILLGNIPPDARISIVQDGVATDSRLVREQYARLRPLEKIRHDARGWTLDVLNVVRGLNKKEFVLQDVYAFAGQLQELHPDNRHVRDKIRQQLQVLRDLGFVEFLGGGRYRSGNSGRIHHGGTEAQRLRRTDQDKRIGSTGRGAVIPTSAGHCIIFRDLGASVVIAFSRVAPTPHFMPAAGPRGTLRRGSKCRRSMARGGSDADCKNHG
jgi:type II restriction enzyme